MDSFNGSVDFTGGKFTVKAIHNPKVQSTQMLIEFTTTETELLNLLLNKYKTEKFISVGTNMSNKVDYMLCKNCCVYAVMPEAKALAFIVFTYAYLMTATLSAAAGSRVTKKQSYTKLHKDITKFDVLITGKCKNTCAKLEDKLPAVTAMKTKLSAVKAKDAADVTPGKPDENGYQEYAISCSNLAKLYFAIFCQQFDFYFDKNKIVMNNAMKILMKEYIRENGSSIKTQLGAFYRQCGALTSKEVIARMNMVINMMSTLHGITAVTISSAKDASVDAEAVKDVKTLISKL